MTATAALGYVAFPHSAPDVLPSVVPILATINANSALCGTMARAGSAKINHSWRQPMRPTMDDIKGLVDETRRCRGEEREARDDLTAIEHTICNLQHTRDRMKTQTSAIALERVATEIALNVAIMRMADLDGPDER